MTFGVGRGTGKTYLAVANGRVGLQREEGEPDSAGGPRWRARSWASAGQLAEKLTHIMRPALRRALRLLEPEKVDKMLEKN